MRQNVNAISFGFLVRVTEDGVEPVLEIVRFRLALSLLARIFLTISRGLEAIETIRAKGVMGLRGL